MGRIKKGLSGSTLKLIALASMLADHTACVLVDSQRCPLLYQILRECVGRIAFPLFCFLLVEGFLHTKNARKYAFRLAVFSLLSEIPFDLLFQNSFWNMEHQNVFFTLLLGFLSMLFIHAFKHLSVKGKTAPPVVRLFLSTAAVILCCASAGFLHTDYGYAGVLLITGFYLLRRSPLESALCNCLFNFWKGQPYGVLSIPFIMLYNGQRGRTIQYLFYFFYPAHLLFLYLISHTGIFL